MKATRPTNTIGQSTIIDAANISAIVLVFIFVLVFFLCLFKGAFRPPLVVCLGVCVFSDQLHAVHFQGADFCRTSEGARALGR